MLQYYFLQAASPGDATLALTKLSSVTHLESAAFPDDYRFVAKQTIVVKAEVFKIHELRWFVEDSLARPILILSPKKLPVKRSEVSELSEFDDDAFEPPLL